MEGPVPVEYRHHNPWVCTNPPERFDSSLGVTVTTNCVWGGDATPQSASLNEIVTTSCVIKAGEALDCDHSPHTNGRWSFAGSNHPIHLGDTIIRTGYICPVSAGGRGFGGGAYDINGHPVGHSGALCGTWIPDTPTVSISGVTVTEGGRAVVTITSSGGSDSGSVDFATVNGSAVAPGDYTATSGRHTFSSSQLSKQVTVFTTDDSDVESSESFTVVLSNPQGVDIGTGTATVTILDNDIAPSPCPAGQTGTPPNCVPIPLPCPAGQTGTPPNCVPIGTPPCPAGQTGTPPNCVPVVVGTGCDAPGTRLAALSVTDGGVEVLSGFDPGTYSYAVTIDGEVCEDRRGGGQPGADRVGPNAAERWVAFPYDAISTWAARRTSL